MLHSDLPAWSFHVDLEDGLQLKPLQMECRSMRAGQLCKQMAQEVDLKPPPKGRNVDLTTEDLEIS